MSDRTGLVFVFEVSKAVSVFLSLIFTLYPTSDKIFGSRRVRAGAESTTTVIDDMRCDCERSVRLIHSSLSLSS